MVTIKVRQNGSLLVEGEDVKLIDWNGTEYYVPKKPFALCRCGGSKEKPFCDSSHKECGMGETQAAPGPKKPPADVPPAA
jgi:CDGSH iron-sulfur domain-containing protein 3